MSDDLQVPGGGDLPARHASPNREKPLRIVGIGASAGGLESLEQLFASLPGDPGMAFVVVQHLSPDFRSMMSELLSRHSRMPVRVAEDGVVVEPDHVYLLPPRKEMTISGGRLRLADKEPVQRLAMPIDLFLRSLAADRGANAVAVVLSGSGSDGAGGVREIKRLGGRVLVESPESAKFDGMPLSALATGVVDHAGTPAELAGVLTGEVRAEPADAAPFVADEAPLDAILRLLRSRFGIDFALYKPTTVGRRVLRRAELRDAESLESYLEDLRDDPEELSALHRDLLVAVTHFFRDPEAFAVLEERVIPRIVESVPDHEEIRVWVAGCASGEEPYSLAMLFFEALAARGRAIHFRVLATDAHRGALEFASRGIYAEEQLEHVSPRRRERFFTKRPDGFQISQDLRQRIVFVPHDVTQDAPLTRMHLVSCRNLLIYLEPEVQKTVLSLFHFGLSSGGILFLGSSESPGAFAPEFVAIDEHWKIYRKRRDVPLLDPLRLPVVRKAVGTSARILATPKTSPSDSGLLAVYDRLLDRYMPPALLVSEDRTLVDSFGGAERHLRIGRRRPSTNVLDLLEGDLRTVVASAIHRVLGGESPVRHRGILRPDDPQAGALGLTAEAVEGRGGARHVLITFEPEIRPRPAMPGQAPAPILEDDASPRDRERFQVLETELAYARETLQAAIEQQQTSNEELQATNEELVASNEELQSTNEELHSVNEELYTVNGEYQKKILELRELNADMQHLLEGTDVGTMFLDRELRIRKFTTRVARVFHVRPDDVGRNLRDFSHELVRPSLFDDIERVMRDGETIEDEVRDRDDTTFFLRILPYRPGAENGGEGETSSVAKGAEIRGVMLSLTDISVLERARARIERLSAIVESSEDAIIGKDLDGVITSWNRGAERLYGYTAAEAVGRDIRMLAPPGYDAQIGEFLAALARGETVEQVETIRRRKDGTNLDVSVTVSPIHDRDGAVIGASAIARDVTRLKRAQREIEEREKHIRLLLDSTAEAIYGLDLDGVCTFCNPACVRLLGFESPDDLIGKRMHALVHHSSEDGSPYPEEDCPICGVLRTGQGTHSDEEVLRRADGSSFDAEYWSYPVSRDGEVTGAVVTFLDVTARKDAARELRLAAERREQFLAMLSHELRNPLGAVISATKVMQARPDDAPATRRARGVVERQTSHMVRLLDDLLDVSRITRGGIQLREEDLDLRDVVRFAVEAVAPHLEERRTELELALPADPLPLRGDPARLQQVVGNLLTNAARYSPIGSPVRVSALHENGHVVLSVVDHGFGITPELLPEIFDLFVQNQQGLDRSLGGLGVGLALVRQLVELHGGTVEARSDGPGKGSEFHVRLPLRAPLRGLAVDGMEADRLAVRSVVVVEDQDDAREMLTTLLETNGLTVYEAKDGETGVQLIERVRPQAALVDIGLPGLDGYGVARRLRQKHELADVLLVAVTGYGTSADVEASRRAGFDEHVTKPADPDRIAEILRRRAQGRSPSSAPTAEAS